MSKNMTILLITCAGDTMTRMRGDPRPQNFAKVINGSPLSEMLPMPSSSERLSNGGINAFVRLTVRKYQRAPYSMTTTKVYFLVKYSN